MSTSPNITGLNLPSVLRARGVNPLRMAPNLLTLLRMLLVPLLVATVLAHRFHVAFALFLVAAGTDAFDGMLARWLRQRTLLGEYLDPLADKLLLSSLFVALTWMRILEPGVALLVFARDFGMLLTAAILYATTDLRNFRPSVLGKANSFSQAFAIALVLLALIDRSPWVAAARTAAIDATILLTVVSGFHYAWVASQRIGLLPGSPETNHR